MLMLRSNLSVTQNVFRFYKLIKHAEHRSKQIVCLTRFGLITGCCFSRQSDKETLIAKTRQDVLGNQTVSNSHTHSTFVQRMTNFLKMKRNHDLCDNISSQHADANIDQLIETSTKRQKIDDTNDGITEEVHPIITPVCPIRETLDLSNIWSIKSEIKKHKADIEKPLKHRPNYFVAIQVSDAQIINALNELQQHMLEEDERLKKSMIQLATLHITLMVMYIGDTETHAKALQTLENIREEHNDDFSTNPLKLEFKGLGHFQNRVLYAKLSSDDSFKRLSSLAESVKKHYSIASICSTDSKKDFTPHLTVAKIQDVRRKKKELLKKIDPSLYKDFTDQYFGSQEVQSIQLLSMTDPKDELGYYSGKEIYFSAFEPKVRRDYLNKLLGTEEKKKDVKEMINALMKEKLK